MTFKKTWNYDLHTILNKNVLSQVEKILENGDTGNDMIKKRLSLRVNIW